MKRLALILFAFLIPASIFAQALPAKLDSLISAAAMDKSFNGSVLVAFHGKVLLDKGYGFRNVRDSILNDPETIFQIASITKQFTSGVVLKLVELNKMTLSDPVSKYYPDFPNGNHILVENLLTHTSGITDAPDTTAKYPMLSKDATVEDKVLAYIGTRKQAFSPGTKWEYSNSAYILLGYIIEDVTEMTYFEAVRQYIFKPLHMNRSSFDMPKVTSGDKATGYTVFTAAAQTEAPAIDPYGPFSAGAMCSTVEDLYKWHRGLQSGKVISEAMQEKAYTPFLHKYGFGWFIDTLQGKRIVFHDGGIQGFNSFISRITADDACVILLNNKPGHNLWPLTKKYSLCFIKKTSIKILRGCAYPAMWQWR